MSQFPQKSSPFLNKIISFFMAPLFVVTAFIINGCDDKNNESQSSDNVLVMGTSADMPPFEYYKNEKIVGFDIELAEMIAKTLGKTLEIKDMDFSALIPALQSGRVDIVLSSMTPTPERRSAIDFSKPYLTLPLAAVSIKDINFGNIENMKGRIIGVQLGSTHEQYAKTLASAHDEITVKSLNKLPELIEELKNKRIDVVLMETTTAMEFQKNNPKLKISTLTDIDISFSVALAKDSPIHEDIDQALDSLRAAGELKSLRAKWFKGL